MAESEEMTVYGRASCEYTTKVKANFDEAGLKYRFADCDSTSEDHKNSKEMWAFLSLNNHKGAVELPVVNMYGILKIQAEATVEAAKLAANSGKGGTSYVTRPGGDGPHKMPDVDGKGKNSNAWMKEKQANHPNAPTSGVKGSSWSW